MKKLASRYLSERAEVFKSPIAGLGVRATSRIKKLDVVAVLGGQIVAIENIAKYWKKMGQVGIQIHEKFFIVPENREVLKKFGVFNHACTTSSNIGFQYESNILYATRTIEPEEELCFDYAFSEMHMPDFKCMCGGKDCRNRVTRNDYRSLTIQGKYGKWFAPYMQRYVSPAFRRGC